MGLAYLPTFGWIFYGKLVGKYASPPGSYGILTNPVIQKKTHTNSVNNNFSKGKLRRSLTLFQQNVGMNIRICCMHRKKH